jgi:hypothetical protein
LAAANWGGRVPMVAKPLPVLGALAALVMRRAGGSPSDGSAAP